MKDTNADDSSMFIIKHKEFLYDNKIRVFFLDEIIYGIQKKLSKTSISDNALHVIILNSFITFFVEQATPYIQQAEN